MSLLDLVAAPPRVAASPGTRIAPEWRFDVAALERAVEQLGIRDPVRIGCAEYANGRWWGMHTHANGVHKITVARWADERNANEVLWHELTHAAQHERDGQAMDERERAQVSLTQRARMSRAEYYADPYEAEALANEQLAEAHPLVK